MAMCVFPVPVPPIRIALRCCSMKPPAARSRTSVSLIGVPSKSKSSRSLATGSCAAASWYLIERAFFSANPALSSPATTCCGSYCRFTAAAMISSQAAFMPLSFSPAMAARISDRSISGCA